MKQEAGPSKIGRIRVAKPHILLSVAVAAALAAAVVGVTARPATSVRHVSGTLQIALPAGGIKLTSAQTPDYVSTGTRHAALFIDGAASPAGQTASCTATNGTGTGCTITWSASLTVPGSHTFAVEIDTGTTVTPNNTVLAEGKASYTVFPGNNALGTGGNGAPLSLNGVVDEYFYNISGCAGSSCQGTLTPADAAAFSILYAGSLTTPTNGQNPTSGNVFDNNGGGTNNLTFSSDTAGIGTVTGTASAPFTSYSSGVLSILGVNSTDAFGYAVTCAAGATGKFGLVSGGASTASGDVTAAELAGLSPVLSYPANTGIDSPNLFTCTGGVASNASGSLVTN